MLNLEQMLESELPQARYLVLELAAVLDRLEEAARREGRSLIDDPRVQMVQSAVNILAHPAAASGRAAQILRDFSDPSAEPSESSVQR